MPGARELEGELAERDLWLPWTDEPLLSMVGEESSQPRRPGNSRRCFWFFVREEGAAPPLGGVGSREGGQGPAGAALAGLPGAARSPGCPLSA